MLIKFKYFYVMLVLLLLGATGFLLISDDGVLAPFARIMLVYGGNQPKRPDLKPGDCLKSRKASVVCTAASPFTYSFVSDTLLSENAIRRLLAQVDMTDMTAEFRFEGEDEAASVFARVDLAGRVVFPEGAPASRSEVREIARQRRRAEMVGRIHEISSLYSSLPDRLDKYKDIQKWLTWADIYGRIGVESARMGDEAREFPDLADRVDVMRHELSNRQLTDFPLLRRNFISALRKDLAEKEIEVSGEDAELTLSAHWFMARELMEESFLQMKEMLLLLRFRSMCFRWSEDAEPVCFPLEPLPDGQIAS